MNAERKQARRYHWLSEGLESFVDQPHAAIEGRQQGEIINLTDRQAGASRNSQIKLLSSLGPDGIVRKLQASAAHDDTGRSTKCQEPQLPNLFLPWHHDVRPSDLSLRRLHGNLAAAANRGPVDFVELLLTPGVGARTIRALALVAEVVHSSPYRFTDPARFSLAHGGKDGHPFPVPLRVYDETIRVMRRAVDRARLGQDDRLAAIRRLDIEARRLEGSAKSVDFADFVAEEKHRSPGFDGRTVFDNRRKASTSISIMTKRVLPPKTPSGSLPFVHKPERTMDWNVAMP